MKAAPLLARLSGGLDRSRWLGPLLMVPTAALLTGLLAYPLILGVWLGFQDAKIGWPGRFIGLENFEYLLTDPIFRLTAFNTGLYTVVTVVFKLALGLALALLLNQRFPGYRLWRSVLLLPWVVPTVLSAFAWWWILDPQFSFINWSLVRLGLIDRHINFLGDAWLARSSLIVANIWRGIPFFTIGFLAGLQAIPRELHEAAAIDGAGAIKRFRYITLPLLRPLIAVQLLFSVIYAAYQFAIPEILLGSNPGPDADLMMTLIYRQSFQNNLFGFGAAASTLLMLLMMVWVLVWYGVFRRDLEVA